MITRIVTMLMLCASSLSLLGQEEVDSVREGLIFDLGETGYSTSFRAVDAVTLQPLIPSNGVIRRGGVYEFDGTNDNIGANLSALSTLSTQRNWTIEIWLNRNVQPGASAWRYVAGSATTPVEKGLLFGLYDVSASLVFYLFNGSGIPPISFLSCGTIPSNTWTHAVVTFERGSLARTYKNGSFVQVQTNAASLAFGTNTYAFQIGSIGSQVNKFYSGRIARFRVWNTCKTPDAIRAMFCDPPRESFPEVTP